MMQCRRVMSALRLVGTTLFAFAVLGGITTAYITGYQFISTDNYYLSFGMYGAILALQLLIQSFFAFLEHRKMRRATTPLKLTRSVALCIAAYQEDPNYLRKCLTSVKRMAYPNMRIIMVIDGNGDEDVYMADIFQEIWGRDGTASFRWSSNFHERGQGVTDGAFAESTTRVRETILGHRHSCIMQQWGGKREVMYTAFKVLGDAVDYVQVCDSDTVLDPAATVEMVKVLEEDPTVGGVGGDVQVRKWAARKQHALLLNVSRTTFDPGFSFCCL
uniref:hyaluronan synthase 2-like n=1 Tax=Myxine glutinosa TaxID=7769 RepID=UPI00358EE370